MITKPKSKASNENPTIQEGLTQIIYADRILNVGLGPAVSRLTLGMEVALKTFSPTVTVIVPTTALIEALAVMQNALHENETMKAAMINGMDALKEQFSKL